MTEARARVQELNLILHAVAEQATRRRPMTGVLKSLVQPAEEILAGVLSLIDAGTQQHEPLPMLPKPFADLTRIGTDRGTNRWFNGLIDEAAIYNSTLSQTQLRIHPLAAFGNTNQPLFTLMPRVPSWPLCRHRACFGQR